jgi:hypothetical protein
LVIAFRTRKTVHCFDYTIESMARAKRAGGKAAGAAKKAKIQDEQEEVEVAPDNAPGSAGLNNKVSETTAENPNAPALEETYEPPLELIPCLIMRDLWKEDAVEVEEALDQLADLCSIVGGSEEEAKKNSEQFFDSGAHSVLLKTLERFPDNMGIQKQGCRAIADATYGSGHSRQSAGSIGMVEAMVKALNAFPQSHNLQANVIGAINNLLITCRENAERFVNAKGIEAVVATMTNFPADAYLQLWCCTILDLCAELLKNQDQLIELDAVTVVGRALKTHTDDEEVKTVARKALTALAKED